MRKHKLIGLMLILVTANLWHGNGLAASNAAIDGEAVASPTISTESTTSVSRTPERLLVYPPVINLTSQRDRQSIVAQIVYDDGITRDVTNDVQVVVADEQLIRREQSEFFPVKDGTTSVKVSFEGLSTELPVKVENADQDPAISFKNDVMPIFAKSGCNTGSCHGAARGKDGFRLSLFGFDPEGDYFRLTREMLGRRIDLALPEECLVVAKATGQVAHTGGTRFSSDSQYYQTVLRWLRSGAPNDSGPVPMVERIELYPESGLLNGEDATQQLTVRAMYSDGSDRDVTSLAYFLTNNDNSAIVDQSGLVTAKNRGEAYVMARFGTHTVGTSYTVLPKDLNFQWSEPAEPHYIDALVNEKLKKLRITPSELCSDAEFVRRVSIDICGIVPTAQEVSQFIGDPDPDKREKYVDKLLARKEFVEIWVMKWSELLQIRSTQQVSYKATLLYYNWIQEQISNNVPVDEMIRKLLGSEGGTFTNASTNFYQNEQDNLKIAENVAQVFMGMRIQCAQCHNHPFDRWTMDDYYSFAAFFSQVGRKQSEDPREQIVFDRRNGEVTNPVTGKVMAPKFLGGDQPETKGKDRRVVLADWLASPDNPYFATNLSNIVWAHFFGRGIVEEVDDVRVSNPPVNKPLLDELGRKFTAYKYDFKKLVRDICTSKTYQRSTQPNETNESDESNFSHAKLRRIRAEILLDVVSQITETQNKFPGLGLGARAVQIADGNTSTYFLTTFGRAKRETVCSCEVKTDPNLSQALHLLNGDTINSKIQQGNVVGRMLESNKNVGEIIDEIYVRCLSRTPTEVERNGLETEVAAQEDKKTALEDIFWAVLNSREFVFNH